MAERKEGAPRVSVQNYELLTILGAGSFGKVRLTKKKNTTRYSCVKIMKKIDIVEGKQVDHVFNEYKILSSISHPFIVNLEGMDQDAKFIYLFMEYIAGGELFNHLREEKSFEPHKAAFYAAQVTLMFEYLHSKEIVYRDLKPQNIMIGVDGYLKLTDFGFAKIIENRTFTLCGTPEYLAPEILDNKGHGKPVDWWTLGVLLYEMIVGIDPFTDDNPLLIYQNILHGNIIYPKGFDSDAKSLVRHLLVKDLSKRYGNLKNGVNDIKQHRFLSTISFSNLFLKKISVPFKPTVQSPSDTNNFVVYDDSGSEVISLKPVEDPFLKW